MMRLIIFILLIIGLFACNQRADTTQLLQNRIDSLENKLADTYKPGFGEFMSGIQAHHSKLWFAGQGHNWKLADFEVHEIMEAIVDIQKYQTERKECQLIGMIYPALDSMNIAIQQRNLALFDKSYILLTNTCNNCHRATNFEFNVVKIPDTQPFSNQEFKINKDVQ
jgi:hypothetical protein